MKLFMKFLPKSCLLVRGHLRPVGHRAPPLLPPPHPPHPPPSPHRCLLLPGHFVMRSWIVEKSFPQNSPSSREVAFSSSSSSLLTCVITDDEWSIRSVTHRQARLRRGEKLVGGVMAKNKYILPLPVCKRAYWAESSRAAGNSREKSCKSSRLDQTGLKKKKGHRFYDCKKQNKKKVVSKSCNVQLDQFDHANMELDGFKEARFLKAQCRI